MEFLLCKFIYVCININIILFITIVLSSLSFFTNI